ncbi:MAG: glutamate synthase-related protein [Thermoguttaceae bacterium]
MGKLGIVDWREDCSNCHNCVKRACVYGFYRDEADTLRNEIGYLDYVYQCKGCLSCVQNCTKNILTRVVNPEYVTLGDDYYSPEIVLSTWFQAETGRIPVSGSGYGGPFSGPGFDSMWTDMSEIVRPTRDGIHGREYINTSVDLGRKLPYLRFDDGRLAVTPPPLAEIPMPVLFDLVAPQWQRGPVVESVARAAAQLGILAVVDPAQAACLPDGLRSHLIPSLNVSGTLRVPSASGTRSVPDTLPDTLDLAPFPVVMVPDGEGLPAVQAALKAEQPQRLVAVRLPATPAAAGRALELTRQGAEIIHLLFDSHGREAESPTPRHARDVLREVHTTLARAGCRDEVTLVASGGIALAEHMAKAILCGADLVAVDVPLILALECRLCGECASGNPCPVILEEIEPEWAVHRLVNLIGAWHSQLLEVLGAMGIREVRRLRGETGRSMFFEDLERETFGRLFGKRLADAGGDCPNFRPTKMGLSPSADQGGASK